MAVREDDVRAARQAVARLRQAVTSLERHYGDSVDRRRLTVDAARLQDDLDLLCGPSALPPPPAPTPPREVIPDTPYTHDFWMDAEDEGLGSSDRRYDTSRERRR